MIKIPKAAFADKTQDGQTVVPATGDSVPLDGFTGTVKSEDGDSLTIELTDYNGSPVEYVDDPAEEAKEGDNKGDMHDSAGKAAALAEMEKNMMDDNAG